MSASPIKAVLARRVLRRTKGSWVIWRVEDRIPVRFTEGVVP
jgi:hypothetical protein